MGAFSAGGRHRDQVQILDLSAAVESEVVVAGGVVQSQSSGAGGVNDVVNTLGHADQIQSQSLFRSDQLAGVAGGPAQVAVFVADGVGAVGIGGDGEGTVGQTGFDGSGQLSQTGVHSHETLGGGGGQLGNQIPVSTATQSSDVVVTGQVRHGLTADGAGAVHIAVAGGLDGLGVAVTAQGAGENFGAVLGAGCIGLHAGVLMGAAGGNIRAVGQLVQLQAGNIAGSSCIGGGIGTELGGGQGGVVVNTTGRLGGVQDKATVGCGDSPGVGGGCHLEVGAGVVVQIASINADGDTAVNSLKGPDRQRVAGDGITGDGDFHAGELATGNGGIHGHAVGHDDELTAGEYIGHIGDQNIRIGCQCDSGQQAQAHGQSQDDRQETLGNMFHKIAPFF